MRLLRSDELWIYDQLIYEYYLNLLWILICIIWYLCISLWIIGLVWPTRLVFLAVGEVLSFGFNLAVLDPSDRRGTETRIVLLPSMIKRWGFHHIAWVNPSTSFIILLELIPLHHVILMRYSILYELNTLDAAIASSLIVRRKDILSHL